MRRLVFFSIAAVIVGSALYMVAGRSTSHALTPEDTAGAGSPQETPPKPGSTYGDSNGITTYFGDAKEDNESKPKNTSGQR
jgi:hypothetical protein